MANSFFAAYALPSRHAIEQAIRQLQSDWCLSPSGPTRTRLTVYEINNGLCEDFGRAVLKSLGRDPTRASLSEGMALVETEEFRKETPVGRVLWDRALLRKHWQMHPPEGTSWATLNKMEAGHHVWLAAQVGDAGQWLHFDAECPEGCSNFFELPLFRRCWQNRWPTEVEVRQAPPLHIF